ncbi:MAG: menaquinone biosynthesis protein [Planctomycetota bacterium]|nr:menaquinone biosynthesis protein [Planctomycetota bacterium]
MSGMVRVGCVPYLCSKVPIHGMLGGGHGCEVVFAVPAELVAMLRGGDLDVALVPAIEYFLQPGYAILPDMSINCRLEAWSVRLFVRGGTDIRRIRRVALDPCSLMSNALLRILLTRKYALSGVEYVLPAAGNDPAADPSLDAFLKIGDAGLTFSDPAWKAVDLGEEWWSFARLPFVFAVWLTKVGTDLQGVDKRLIMSKREGLRQVAVLARQYGVPLGLPERKAIEYMSRVIGYDLSNVELGGLKTFYRYAVQMDMAEEGREFVFYNRT